MVSSQGLNPRLVHRFDAKRHTTPANAIGIELAPNLDEEGLPKDLDRG